MIKVPRASEASATPTGADLFADDDSLEAAAATRGWAAPGRRSGRCHRYPPSARARWPGQTAESRRSESASTDRAPPVQLASGVVRRLVGTPRCSVTSRHCVDGMGGRLGRRRHSTITVVGGGLGRTLAGTVQQVRHLQRMLQRRTPRRFTTMPHHPRPRKA